MILILDPNCTILSEKHLGPYIHRCALCVLRTQVRAECGTHTYTARVHTSPHTRMRPALLVLMAGPEPSLSWLSFRSSGLNPPSVTKRRALRVVWGARTPYRQALRPTPDLPLPFFPKVSAPSLRPRTFSLGCCEILLLMRVRRPTYLHDYHRSDACTRTFYSLRSHVRQRSDRRTGVPHASRFFVSLLHGG